MVPPAVAANATLYPHLNFDFIRDRAPVAGVVRVPNVVEVNPSVPVKTIPELIAYAKANPGKLSFASAGIGTASHLAGQLFNKMTGVNLQHVPYRGDGPAMADLIAGQVQVGFATMTASIGLIRAGRLRPLAVTTLNAPTRLPDVPTVSEFVPGFEASSWFGVAAPKGTPAEIIERLNREINAGLADADDQSAACRYGRHGAHRLAGRFRQAHRRRNRQMGQSHSRGRHQGGVDPYVLANQFERTKIHSS